MGTRGQFWKRRPTITLAVSVSIVVVVVVIISQNIRTDKPTTRDGVVAEVLVDVDSIAATLPAGTVTTSSDESKAAPCPDGTGGEEISVSRTLTVGPDFDRYAWMGKVTQRYEELGWSVTTQARGGRGNLALKFVGRQLLIYRVSISTDTDPQQVIIRSVSRCTDPAASQPAQQGRPLDDPPRARLASIDPVSGTAILSGPAQPAAAA
jgi:hypothetical protein